MWVNSSDTGILSRDLIQVYVLSIEPHQPFMHDSGDLMGRAQSNTPVNKTRLTRDIQPTLVQCWTCVEDAGPTLNQYWANVSRKVQTSD